MSTTFTDDDIGKTVETAAGDTLGVVTDVSSETAYVEPETDVTDSTRAALDWGTPSEDTVPLSDDVVDTVTDDAIRLEAEFPAKSVTSGSSADGSEEDVADGRSVTGDDDPGEQNVEYTPGEPVGSSGTDPWPDTDRSETGTAGRDEPGPGMDELDEAGSGLADTAAEIDGDAERDPDTGGSVDEASEPAAMDPAAELDSVEEEARRELEVDPTELADDDADVEVRPEEDVANRPDARDESSRAAGPTTEDGAPEDPAAESESERNGDITPDEDTERSNAEDESREPDQ